MIRLFQPFYCIAVFLLFLRSSSLCSPSSFIPLVPLVPGCPFPQPFHSSSKAKALSSLHGHCHAIPSPKRSHSSSRSFILFSYHTCNQMKPVLLFLGKSRLMCLWKISQWNQGMQTNRVVNFMQMDFILADLWVSLAKCDMKCLSVSVPIFCLK